MIIEKKMQDGGAEKWQLDEYPTAMNMKNAYFYKNIFKNKIDELFSKSTTTDWRGCINADDAEHPNRYAAARQLGCDPDELLIRGFQFAAVK
jgi:hypothetical protein